MFIIKTILSIDEFTRQAFDEVGNIHYALSFKWQTMLSLKALYERNISTKHVFISIARVSFIATDNRNKMNTEHNCICIIIPKLLHLCNIYFPNSRNNYLIHYIFFSRPQSISFITSYLESRHDFEKEWKSFISQIGHSDEQVFNACLVFF